LPPTPVALLDSSWAPTASVLPSVESDTLPPNSMLVRVFEGFTYACCDQAPAARVKTYTAPEADAEKSV
jgi:hypothetical protein